MSTHWHCFFSSPKNSTVLYWITINFRWPDPSHPKTQMAMRRKYPSTINVGLILLRLTLIIVGLSKITNFTDFWSVKSEIGLWFSSSDGAVNNKISHVITKYKSRCHMLAYSMLACCTYFQNSYFEASKECLWDVSRLKKITCLGWTNTKVVPLIPGGCISLNAAPCLSVELGNHLCNYLAQTHHVLSTSACHTSRLSLNGFYWLVPPDVPSSFLLDQTCSNRFFKNQPDCAC